MKAARRHAVELGSPIPIVPAGDFSRLHLTRSEADAIWTVIGPSVAMNLNRFPLRSVIIAAYCEGLNHGHGLATEAS